MRRRDLYPLLSELGYRASVHQPPLFSPDNVKGRPDDVWASETGRRLVSLNLICAPKEKSVTFDLPEVTL